MVHGCAFFVKGISVWRLPVCIFGSVHGCAFLLPMAIILRVGLVFPPFC